MSDLELSVFLFHLYVGSGAWIQVRRLPEQPSLSTERHYPYLKHACLIFNQIIGRNKIIGLCKKNYPKEKTAKTKHKY